jgi:hypothetical protein
MKRKKEITAGTIDRLKKEFDINREAEGEGSALFSLIAAAYSIGYQNGKQ